MKKGGRFLARRKSKKSVWIKALAVVLFAALLLGAIGVSFVYSKLNRIQRAQAGSNQLTDDVLAGLLAEDPTASYIDDPEPESTDVTIPKETTPGYGKMGKVINVLLIGQDAREGEESKNADTVILITINK